MSSNVPICSKGVKPQLIEGDIFKIIIPLAPKEEETGIGEKTTEKTREKTREKTKEKTREKIISILKERSDITIKELAEILEITEKGVEWQIAKLKKEGKIKRVGPDKGGHWEVVK